MNLLTRKDLTELMNKQDDICISIYMPTYRAGTQIQQGRIRLKNQLREAETRLVDNGMRSPEAKQLLHPAQQLVLNNQFWQQQRDCLAIFLAADIFHYYRLPIKAEEFLQIGQRFHLKPLLPLLSGDGLFFILALSQNSIRVLRCTRSSVSELDIEAIPHSLDEAMQFDDSERQLQLHSNTLEGTNAKAAAIFHGHGVGVDDSKDNILRFFRLIDRGLHNLLREEKAPLVLAGVEFLFSIYREANTYAYLTDECLPGNPEELDAEDLQTLVWPLVEHYYHKSEQEALTYYGPFNGTGRTTHDIKKAAPAAYNGQVELLFLAAGAQQRGSFDPQIDEVRIPQETELGDEDLYDFTAIQTILNGGTVYLLEADKVPDGEPMAALLRY
jgi:hypothetical protein